MQLLRREVVPNAGFYHIGRGNKKARADRRSEQNPACWEFATSEMLVRGHIRGMRGSRITAVFPPAREKRPEKRIVSGARPVWKKRRAFRVRGPERPCVSRPGASGRFRVGWRHPAA